VTLLRHCATSLEVVGSVPYQVIGTFHFLDPFVSTLAMGSTQPVTEMSIRNRADT